MKNLLVLCSLLAGLYSHAGEMPYNESSDAKRDVKQALIEAAKAKKPVLLVFGANWCEDCRALDTSLKTDRNAKLMAEEFKVVKIDVGRFDKNLDLDTVYGNPIKKGIPAVVVLAPDQRVLYATRAGELANARGMDAAGVYGFFHRIVEEAAKPAK
ncbi:thioredoxin family protein [Chitinimonas arctica]|uniref:Thioredoxin family protein n=1 Tax=Chitinimonas arctica TaxID=2594795 RepID=A0A516SKC0_9NEIS|nr:thioredoxin family protein [Chitinimonas arctica]QDQ28605.1 thioredoxin family protein [Chitinimonas arctica]